MSDKSKEAKLEEILRELKARRPAEAQSVSPGPQRVSASRPATFKAAELDRAAPASRPAEPPVFSRQPGATGQSEPQLFAQPFSPARPQQSGTALPAEAKPEASEDDGSISSILDTVERGEDDTRSDAEIIEENFRKAVFHEREVGGRSFIRALGYAGDDLPPQEEAPVNKSMLAPTIERGFDEATDEADEPEGPVFRRADMGAPASEPEAEATTDAPDEATRHLPEEHPLFTTNVAAPVFIPEESPEQRSGLTGTVDTAAVTDNTVALEEMARKVERSGVLNVKENAEDDEFKVFFSDTVIIDSKPLRSRIQKPKRIKDFKLADEENPQGGPVFEEEPAEAADDAADEEFTFESDAESIQVTLAQRRARAVVRTLFTGIVALALVYLNVALEFSLWLPAVLTDGGYTLFMAANAALLLLAIALNAGKVFAGFGRLICFRPDCGSVTSFAALASLIELGAVFVLGGGSLNGGFAAPIAAVGLFMSSWGEAMDHGRILSNFHTISTDYEKYATAAMDDEKFTRRITRSLELPGASVLLKRKTGFTDGFFHYSGSDCAELKPTRLVSVMFFISLICGGVAYVRSADLLGAIRTVALAAAFTAPFTATLTTALPMAKMSKHLSRLGSVVPGYPAVEEIVSANCVVLEGREVFPKGNVMLHGIKTFEKERIDKAILYAASVLIQSCDTMSGVFLNVIQGKTEMLFDVDGVVYEDGLGFSFWVDKDRVLLGTRELLQNHEIEVPSRDYENRYTKKSTRDAIYLAVSGRLYAMFVVSYAPNAEVEKALRGFEREGVTVLIRTRDFNVTAERVARIYRIPRSMVAIVEENDVLELGRRTDYVSHTRAALTHIGSLSSFVGGILACYNLRSAIKVSSAVQMACLLVGATLALALAAFGALSGMGATSALAFQTCWLLVSSLLVALRRY